MYTLEDIQAVDMEVADAITKEFDRQNSHIKPGSNVSNGQCND